MKRLALLFLFLAPSAAAVDLLDRVQLREKPDGKDRWGRQKYTVVASLAPARYFHAPLLQVFPIGGGGGGGIISGVTAISGGADTQVCFNDAGTLSCGDAGLVYTKSTGTLGTVNLTLPVATSTTTLGATSTAGTAITLGKGTITGTSAISNFLNITGTNPATLSAATYGLRVDIVPDDDAQTQSAGYFSLGGANAGAASYALRASNLASTNGIFCADDNGTCVLTISDGGVIAGSGLYTFNGGWTLGSATATVPAGTNNIGLTVGTLGTVGMLLQANTTLTPDGPSIQTGSTSVSVKIHEYADRAFDFQNFCTTGLGTAACTDPTLIIQSHNQDTGEALSFAHDAKAGVIVGGNSTALSATLRLGGTVTLTGGAATTVAAIPVATETGTGGKVSYTVYATDDTDMQSRSGTVHYQVVNKAGTETCVVNGIDALFTINPNQTQDGSSIAASSGTLTYAWAVDVTGTNTCALTLNAVSSLTETTLRIDYLLIQHGPGVPTGG